MAISFNPFTKKKQEELIPASGYGSQYASNPSNYGSTSSIYATSLSQGKGLPSITGQTLNVPSFQQKQQATQNIVRQANQPQPVAGPAYAGPVKKEEQKVVPSGVPSYITGYENLTDRQKALLEQQKKQGEEYYGQSYGERNRLLQESIPQLQSQMIKTQGNIQKGVESAQKSAEFKKQNTEDQWGESQRLAAQTRGESEARNRNRFAALGTTDSWGAGSYGQAQENVESDFNRFTQQGLRTKEQNMFEIDKALQDYEIEAQTTLDDLEFQVNTAIRQIQSDMRMNDIEKRNAIDTLFNDYQAKVLEVEEGMQGVYADYYKALESAEANSLSDVFMQTGQPQTEADFRYMTENYEALEKMKSPQGGQNQGKALSLVNSLLQGNIGAVSGGFRTPGFIAPLVPGAAAARADYEGIKNLLSLAERGQLKGSGAVSDFEARMLEKAALAGLSTELPEDEFIRRLQFLKADLEAGGAVAPERNINRPSLSSFER